jgi:hypothetical protein
VAFAFQLSTLDTNVANTLAGNATPESTSVIGKFDAESEGSDG